MEPATILRLPVRDDRNCQKGRSGKENPEDGSKAERQFTCIQCSAVKTNIVVSKPAKPARVTGKLGDQQSGSLLAS